jgi:hypothetical protein
MSTNSAEYNQKWRSDHPGYDKAWRANNKDEVNARRKARRHEAKLLEPPKPPKPPVDPALRWAKAKTWKHANNDKVRGYNKTWRDKNRTYKPPRIIEAQRLNPPRPRRPVLTPEERRTINRDKARIWRETHGESWRAYQRSYQ